MNTDDIRSQNAAVCMPFVCRDGRLLPRCHDQLTDLPPGLYLALFHGRNDPDTGMDDWGFDGPVIGPLEYVHTTYASDVTLRFVDGQTAARYFPDTGFITNLATGVRTCCTDAALAIAHDLIVFDGRYFDDWSVFVAGQRT
ncbi:hypothetical protein WJ542_05620 [Paraburkholderia sp. B3]|uniref:hypothetical protein n=1 Tax=Paraburkholderia sp. B3 TaxID=3134791 RepID=UPI0039826C24